MKHKIVLVPFPFDDFSTHKVRPALCLTPIIGQYRHVVVAFITSRQTSDPELSDFVIETSHTGFAATGLKQTSTLRLHRLLTMPVSIIKRELGMLPSNLQVVLDQKLKQLFQLS